MKKRVSIQLDDANKVKYEILEQFERSVFRDVYAKAFRMVYSVIRDNQQFRDDEGTAPRRNDEQIYNAISFFGERGMGKTSAMMSFMTVLDEQFRGEQTSPQTISLVNALSNNLYSESMRNLSFSALDYIDATLLVEKEEILDVILARMWDKYEAISKDPKKDRRQELMEPDLKDQFECVRASYLQLKRITKGSLDESKEISSLSTLHKLAASMNLRKDLIELVDSYLGFLNSQDSHRTTNNFLIISIDDIDMGSGNTYGLLEQIRRFLTIPHVIIFLTADPNRLMDICRNKSSLPEGSDSESSRFVNDYLAKLLPHNSRIYMPDLKEVNGINQPEYTLNFQLKHEKAASSHQPIITQPDQLTEKDTILKYLANYLHLYFDGMRGIRHFLQHSSMRSLVNYFKNLVDIIENNYESSDQPDEGLEQAARKLDWFKQDLRYRIAEESLTHKQKKEFERLFYLEPQEVNSQLIKYIWRELSAINSRDADIFDKEYKQYGADYGLILRGCHLIESNDLQYRPFINCIILFYTILMTGRRLNIYENSASFPNGMIQGSWCNNQHFFNGSTQTYHINLNRLSLNLSIPKVTVSLVNGVAFIENPLEDTVKTILKDNADAILVFQALMLMYRDVVLPGSHLEDFSLKAEVKSASSPKAPLSKAGDRLKQEQEWPETVEVFIVLPENQRFELSILNFVSNLYSFSEYTYAQKALRLWPSKLASAIYQGICDFCCAHKLQFKRASLDFSDTPVVKTFLYSDFEEWKKTYPKHAALPFENVELMYTLEKRLSKLSMLPTSRDYYEFTHSIYLDIQNELKKRDNYYKSIDVITQYEQCFADCPFIRVFMEKTEQMKAAYEYRLVSIADDIDNNEPAV